MSYAGSNSLLGRAYGPIAQFMFLKTVHKLVQVENDVGAVRYEYPSFGIQTLLLEIFQFSLERRYVDYNT